MTDGLENKNFPMKVQPAPTVAAKPGEWKNYLWSFLVIGALTFPGYLLRQTLDTAAIAMFYLLALVGIAVWLGRGPAIAASFLGVLALDYFINPPYFSFTVTSFASWMTLILMLVESLVISTLAARLKEQVRWAEEREIFTSLLYDLGPQMVEEGGEGYFLEAVESYLGPAVEARVNVFLADRQNHLQILTESSDGNWEEDATRWAYSHGRKTGMGFGSYPRSRKLYLPMRSSPRVLGVLAFDFPDPRKAFSTGQMGRLEGFAAQIAAALERHLLFLQAEEHRIAAENEKNRSALLSAVSHDLRTPLTGIIGASSSLLEDKGNLSLESRVQLTRSIYNEAERMKQLIQNLLDMTRLEAGALVTKKEWESMEELVGATVNRLIPRLATHPLALDLQPGLPLVFVDGLLVEQLLLNLLENALNHTPEGASLQLSASATDGTLKLEVADRGPGLVSGEEKSIFEKFTQGYHSGGKGAGLGLAICRGIVQSHGGTIEASNREGGGALFTVHLPTGGRPPVLQEE